MKIKIRVEHLAKRCEICHQDDLFNAQINICGRCEGIGIIISSPSPNDIVERRESFWQPRFVAGIIFPFIFAVFLIVSALIIKLFLLFAGQGDFFDLVYALIIFGGLILAAGAETLLFMTLVFVVKVMISDRWEGG